MRTATVSAYQYRNFLYPFIVGLPVQNLGEWDVALRVLKKLKDPALTEEVPLTPEEEKARAEGRPVYPYRRLLGGSLPLQLEEEEYKFIRARLESQRTSVLLGAAEDFAVLLDTIAQASTVI